MDRGMVVPLAVVVLSASIAWAILMGGFSRSVVDGLVVLWLAVWCVVLLPWLVERKKRPR